MKKHDEKLDEGHLKLSSFVAFLMGFSQAVLAVIMSAYFVSASGTQNVGFFYAFAYLIFLVVLLNLHKFVRLLGKANVFYFSLLAKIVGIVFLTLNQP